MAISDDVRKQPLQRGWDVFRLGFSGDLGQRHLPEPQDLAEDGPNQAVDHDVRPLLGVGPLERLPTGVVQDEEERPQEEEAEEAHEAKEHGYVHLVLVLDLAPQEDDVRRVEEGAD